MRSIALIAAAAIATCGAGSPAYAAGPKHPSKRYCRKHVRKLTRGQRRWCKRHARHTQSASSAAGPLTQPPAVDPAIVQPGGTPTTAPAAARLAVQAKEYSLTLSRLQIAAGPAIVELQNDGEDPHNLRIEPLDGGSAAVDFSQTGPGQLTKQRLTLTAGSYRLFCTLGTHDALGMHGTLTVAAATP